MIRIAIVEDDRHDREALKKCLNRYEKENQVKFSVTEFQDGEDIVTDYTASYDLIILDIEMAFLNGMKAAEKIRELDTNVIIIFITNMPQYAIQEADKATYNGEAKSCNNGSLFAQLTGNWPCHYHTNRSRDSTNQTKC